MRKRAEVNEQKHCTFIIRNTYYDDPQQANHIFMVWHDCMWYAYFPLHEHQGLAAREQKKNTACIYGYLPMAPFNWKNKTYKHFISFCSQICERRLLTKCPNDGFMEMDSQWTEPHNVGTLCHSIITNIATTTTHAREYWKRKKCSG